MARLDSTDNELRELKEILHNRIWFGFDLDDTLHEFRNASGTVSQAVFEKIHEIEPLAASQDQLASTYREILARTTASAFTDGKMSFEYRKGRFRTLMDVYDIACTDQEMIDLAELYKSALQASLELKPGAYELLQHLKSIGKKVAIITEGPDDSQIWTVEQLGLSDVVDVVLTTNKVGKSKVDGLFAVVLKQLDIRAEEMVYVGDSLKRDIEPATKEGIFRIHYAENEEVCLEATTCKLNNHY